MRVIDGDKLTERLKFLIEDNEELLTSSIVRAVVLTTVALMPAVNAVPVVRCRDCEHYNVAGCNEGCGWCERDGMGHGSFDDFYCANGERKGGKE